MLIRLHHTVSEFFGKHRSFWLLILRLSLGLIFIQTGWGKLTHISMTTEFFSQLGIPFPYLNAMAASSIELLAGLGLIVGLAVRPSALGIIVVMGVAIATAKIGDITSVNSFIGMQEWDYIVMAGIILASGGGNYSLEALLLNRETK